MLRVAFLTFLLLLLALPAGAVAQTAAVPVDETKPATNSLSADQFVDLVAVSSLYEIAAGELAVERAQDPAVKAFAAQSVEDHRKLLLALRNAAEEAAMVVEIPERLDEGALQKFERLRAAATGEFEPLYVAEQRESRKAAALLFANYAEAGDLEELRLFAEEMETLLAAEFEAIMRIPAPSAQ